MEEHLGRFLESHEHVHHLNSNRTDNRLENLEVFASVADHMAEQWAGRGWRNPELVELVRKAASDPTVGIEDLPMSNGVRARICREHGIEWIPVGRRGHVRLLTEQKVREALQARTTHQAAAFLKVNVMTLYNRFDHLLKKRAKPGFLDASAAKILKLVYKLRVSREEVGRQYGVSATCVTKSIQRWKAQGATLDGSALPKLPRSRPGPIPGRKALDKARSSRQPPKNLPMF
jgi:hypothetical protein